jgi:hypothetical protein
MAPVGVGVISVAMVLAVLSFLGIIVLLWLAVGPKRAKGPSCGKCGYMVEGLQDLSCPECGSDLRKVGIDSPRSRMMPPIEFFVCWTALLILPLLVMYTLAHQAGPRVYTMTATFGLESNTGSMPVLMIEWFAESRSPALNSFFTSSSTTSSYGEDGETETTFRFPTVKNQTIVDYEIDVRTEDAAAPQVTLDKSSVDSKPLDPEMLAVLFSDENSVSREYQAEVAAMLTALLRGDPSFTSKQLTYAGSNTARGNVSTPGWYTWSLVAACAALYCLGIIWFMRVRGKRKATADS